MSLSKAIEHGKEHRKEYRGSKLIDKTCRNHGSCDWCYGNRMHSTRQREQQMDDQYEDYIDDEDVDNNK